MARKPKWNEDDRKKLLKMVQAGVYEQEIRAKFDGMTSPQFAQQLKLAMVEAGQIKQAPRGGKAKPAIYRVTDKGRLTITDFADQSGFRPGDKLTLEKPRGKSRVWRLVPVS